jgi:hypothetical protein
VGRHGVSVAPLRPLWIAATLVLRAPGMADENAVAGLPIVRDAFRSCRDALDALMVRPALAGAVSRVSRLVPSLWTLWAAVARAVRARETGGDGWGGEDDGEEDGKGDGKGDGKEGGKGGEFDYAEWDVSAFGGWSVGGELAVSIPLAWAHVCCVQTGAVPPFPSSPEQVWSGEASKSVWEKTKLPPPRDELEVLEGWMIKALAALRCSSSLLLPHTPVRASLARLWKDCSRNAFPRPRTQVLEWLGAVDATVGLCVCKRLQWRVMEWVGRPESRGEPLANTRAMVTGLLHRSEPISVARAMVDCFLHSAASAASAGDSATVARILHSLTDACVLLSMIDKFQDFGLLSSPDHSVAASTSTSSTPSTSSTSAASASTLSTHSVRHVALLAVDAELALVDRRPESFERDRCECEARLLVPALLLARDEDLSDALTAEEDAYLNAATFLGSSVTPPQSSTHARRKRTRKPHTSSSSSSSSSSSTSTSSSSSPPSASSLHPPCYLVAGLAAGPLSVAATSADEGAEAVGDELARAVGSAWMAMGSSLRATAIVLRRLESEREEERAWATETWSLRLKGHVNAHIMALLGLAKVSDTLPWRAALPAWVPQRPSHVWLRAPPAVDRVRDAYRAFLLAPRSAPADDATAQAAAAARAVLAALSS